METKLPSSIPLSLPPCLSHCVFLSSSAPAEPGSPCCDIMASGAQLITVTSLDHSHTLQAIPSVGLSPLLSQKRVWGGELISFFPSMQFIFSSCALLSLLPYVKGNLLCTHTTTLNYTSGLCTRFWWLQKHCWLSPALAFLQLSWTASWPHKKAKAEEPRRSRRCLPVIKYLLFAQLFLCLRVGSMWRSETSGSRLMKLWQYFGSRKLGN